MNLEDTFISPSVSELLAAYIRQYSFLDLFVQEFQYTLTDLSLERDFSLLSAVVSSQSLDIDDEERIKVIMLSLENLHSEEDMGIIKKAFLVLLKNSMQTCWFARKIDYSQKMLLEMM